VSAKHLYRVTATYWDGRVWRRDYQTLGAANERRDRLMDDGTRLGLRKPVVTIERSDPVTWPNEATP
jgi:hypothetical protein